MFVTTGIWASWLILGNVSVYAGNSYRNRGKRACHWRRSVSSSSCYLDQGHACPSLGAGMGPAGGCCDRGKLAAPQTFR